MTTDYELFLASKQRQVPEIGPTVAYGAVHPSLFDFQRHIVRWAVKKGRAALFADTGLGKTRMQVEWARLVADRALILAPLSVARQTVREAARIDVDVAYVRSADQIGDGPGVWITNYEMAEHFDPALFDAVVLDESSILKNVDGRTRARLTEQFSATPYRLACTATPAPNDVAELCNHAEFLGVMPRVEMLASFFVHDDDGWRLKGHAVEPMYRWMASWAMALRRPSDLGYPDDDYDLPPLRIHAETVDVHVEPEDGALMPSLGGIGGRAKVRHATLGARVERAAKLASGSDDQWIIWAGLNEEADQVTKLVPGAVNVHGSMTPDAKAEAIEAFQDGKYRVLVSKVALAGFGLNLQNAHRMVFLGIGDSYEAYYQAIRRCYRFGQTAPVDVHIVVSELEQEIVSNVRRKEADAHRTTDALIRYMGQEVAA